MRNSSVERSAVVTLILAPTRISLKNLSLAPNSRFLDFADDLLRESSRSARDDKV